MTNFIPKNWVHTLLTLLLLTSTPLQNAFAADPFQSLSDLSEDLGLGGGGGGADEILEPDQAFMLSTASENGQVIARWDIADGHYMYQDKIKITPAEGSGITGGTLQLKKGKLKHDEYFGEIYVYYNEAEARLPLTANKNGVSSSSFKIKYQGCSEISGICYPPITKEVTID